MPNLDTLIASIDDITTELKNIDNKTFTLEELMTDDFIKNHTPFFSFDNLFNCSFCRVVKPTKKGLLYFKLNCLNIFFVFGAILALS